MHSCQVVVVILYALCMQYVVWPGLISLGTQIPHVPVSLSATKKSCQRNCAA